MEVAGDYIVAEEYEACCEEMIYKQILVKHNIKCSVKIVLSFRSPIIRSLYVVASKFEGLESSIKQFVFKTQSSATCGSSASVAGSSDPLCGSSASSDPVHGSCTTVVRSSDPTCGSTSVVRSFSSSHGLSASVVRSDPTYGSSAYMSGSSDTMSRSSGLTSGSSASSSGSSASSSGTSTCVVRSSDLMPGSLPSMCGSYPEKLGSSMGGSYSGSSKHDDNTSMARTLTTHQHTASSTHVQPQLDISTDHHETHSSDGSPVSPLHQPQDNGHPAGHHKDDHHLRLCTSACGNDSSYQRHVPVLGRTCQDIPPEGPGCDSRNVSRKMDTDKINVKHIEGDGQIQDPVVGLESVTTVTRDNNAVDNQNNVSGDMVQCHKCGVSVGVWEVTEHSDFHLAVELQEKETSQSNGKRKSTDGASNTTKRRNSVKNATTLHRFFEAT